MVDEVSDGDGVAVVNGQLLTQAEKPVTILLHRLLEAMAALAELAAKGLQVVSSLEVSCEQSTRLVPGLRARVHDVGLDPLGRGSVRLGEEQGKHTVPQLLRSAGQTEGPLHSTEKLVAGARVLVPLGDQWDHLVQVVQHGLRTGTHREAGVRAVGQATGPEGQLGRPASVRRNHVVTHRAHAQRSEVEVSMLFIVLMESE